MSRRPARGARRDRPVAVPPVELPVLVVESLDQEGRGVGHAGGKVVFIDGALAGEEVGYASRRSKPSYEIADVGPVYRESVARVVPRCPHFGVCGGCSMQHLEASSQVAVKQRVLEDHLWHIGRVRPSRVLPPIHGPAWGYRHRARLSVRLVEKKGGVLVGFHERRSSFVADMRECHVVPPHVSALLLPLRDLVASLSIARRLPQIELAIGEEGEGNDQPARSVETILVLRILDPLTDDDVALLNAFAERHGIVFWLQPKGPDTVVPLEPTSRRELHYDLPEFDVRIHFQPTDFTQVNAAINRVLVGRALRLLDAQPGDRIADLFCGLGNFSLPIARTAAYVVGVEGSAAMTTRAADNARRNGLEAKTTFSVANLFEVDDHWFDALGPFDRMLIDPPREGAVAVAKALATVAAPPRRIVYVSCNPSTLARDAAVLTHEAGYTLAQAGIVNMFPQTSHVESIAVFDRLAAS